MNSKGFDIAITTVILIIIGVAVLIGLIFFVKNGFGFFKEGTDPILRTQSLEATRQACELVCRSGNEIAFCCDNIELNKNAILCNNATLNVGCEIDCTKVSCN
ncbi:MAG: hypothetical protein AABW89_01735 [Nanoarchaeota archaeon]